MLSVAKQIRDIAEKSNKTVKTVAQRVIMATGAEIIAKTPVGNPELWQSKPTAGYVGGALRGSWQTALNVSPDSVTVTIDKTGQIAQVALASITQQLDIGDTVHFVNTLPYAERVENGWSQQAPTGMVKITIADLQSIVKEQARALGVA